MSRPIITDLYDNIADALEYNFNKLRIEKLWLGGGPGAHGGSGVRPGGFYGQLIQPYVAYDTTEDATLTGSGSLLDNLNHIRYRLRGLEDTNSILSPHIARWHVASGVSSVEFPDMAYEVLTVTHDGLVVDPQLYSLSDYTTLNLEITTTSGAIITAQYIVLMD